MGGVLGLAIVAVAVGTALVAGLVLHQRALLPAGADVPPEVVRTTATWRWTGVTAGLAVSGVLLGWEVWDGRGVMLAAPAFGLCVLAGVIMGEARARPAQGTTRSAALEVRKVRDYLPRGLTRVVATAAVVLLVLLVATTVTGSTDNLGRAGRALQVQCDSLDMPGAVEIQTRSPWAGAFYSGPLALGVLAGLATGWVALERIVRRARTREDATAMAADDALRRRAARGVTAACGLLVTIPLAGVSVVTALPLLSITCIPTWATMAGVGLLALAPAMAALITWCLAVILAATPRARSAQAAS